MRNKYSSGLYYCVLLLVVLILTTLNTSCDMTGNEELASDKSVEATLKSKSFLPGFPGAGEFVTGFTNPYLAFDEGKVFHYEGETDDGRETIVVTVTGETKEIYGVMATVVSDIAYLDGEMVEKTEDWYAEDTEGNVWYFGEYSEEYENGELVGTGGSWEAGVDGALPGVLMYANPKIGMKYQQEYFEGEAEDMAIVLSLKKTIEIDYGTFEDCLETMEWSPLEPGAREHKFYKKGVGLVQELQPNGGRSTVDLVSVEMP